MHYLDLDSGRAVQSKLPTLCGNLAPVNSGVIVGTVVKIENTCGEWRILKNKQLA